MKYRHQLTLQHARMVYKIFLFALLLEGWYTVALALKQKSKFTNNF